MEELIKKIEDRIKHLQNEKIHMRQFVRSAKLAEAQKIHDWVIECSKLRQDAVIGTLPLCKSCGKGTSFDINYNCFKCGNPFIGNGL